MPDSMNGLELRNQRRDVVMPPTGMRVHWRAPPSCDYGKGTTIDWRVEGLKAIEHSCYCRTSERRGRGDSLLMRTTFPNFRFPRFLRTTSPILRQHSAPGRGRGNRHY